MKRIIQITSILIIISLFIISEILLHSCAQMRMPEGGEKDTIAPIVISCIPDSFSTNFDSKKITIELNEFFSLKNINQVLVVSPPLSEKPIIDTKGKSILIDLNNELKDSTTYTIDFGNAIQDFTENNPLKDYQYVFSTYNVVDSLRIYGLVLDAQTHKPVENAWVMVYQNYNDSTPITTLPDYIDKTDAKGVYSIQNIKGGKYRIFALTDANLNLLFDQPKEAIAFDTATYTPSLERITVADTLKIEQDSLSFDSITYRQQKKYSPDSIVLYHFTEDRVKLYLAEFKRTENKRVNFVFSRECETVANIEPLSFEPTTDKWFVPEISPKNDTIVYWLTDSINYNADTLKFKIQYYKPDSVGNTYYHTDTLNMRVAKKDTKSDSNTDKTPKDEKTAKVKKGNFVVVKHNLEKPKIDLGQDFIFEAAYPIKQINTDSIRFTEFKNDTTKIPVAFKIMYDSISPRKFVMKTNIKPGTKYQLMMDTTVITDIYEHYNDTIEKTFTSPREEEFGKIVFDITGTNSPLIVQMLSGDKITKEIFIQKPQTVEFPYLSEGEYIFRVIVDENGSKKWDTGNYLKKIQPERIIYFQQKVKVKANIDNILPWDLSAKQPLNDLPMDSAKPDDKKPQKK